MIYCGFPGVTQIQFLFCVINIAFFAGVSVLCLDPDKSGNNGK